MSTPFKPLQIPAGVVSMGTKNMRSSNWAEVNLIRWREGNLMPMGGQQRLSNLVGGVETYKFASTCKKIHSWIGLDGLIRIAYLCEQNLYVDTGGALTDITPIGGIIGPTSLVGGFGQGPFGAGTFGTPRPLSLSASAHSIPDAYSLDNFGSILYAMTSSDSRLLMWNPAVGPAGLVASLATTASFTTASPNITMPTNPGTVLPGMGVYNVANQQVGTVLTYVGTALVLTANAAFAGALGAVLRFGNFAMVQPASPGRGPVPNGRCFITTPQRFIMIFGSINDGTADGGSPRRFAWCDQENPGAWDYSSVTSQAGFLDVEPSSPIMCALSSRVGILFWTSKKAYSSQFLGLPYVYNYVELGDGATPWSPQSMVTTSSLPMWMAEEGIFSFDGTTIAPIACPVRSWIDDDIDPVYVREYACAVHFGDWNEFWWFYPQLGQPTNTRAMIYNYKEGWFSQAHMSRSAGNTSSYITPTILADMTVAFMHEGAQSYTYDSLTAPVQLPFAETFDLNLNSGGYLTTVKQIMPDVDGPGAPNLLYSVFYRNSRSTGTPEMQSPPRYVNANNGFVDLRVTGRDIRLRIDYDPKLVYPFTIGQHLIDAVRRGDR